MKMAAHDGQVPGIKYGTVQYLAPEVLSSHVMTKKADVYSFGIIMWEVWHSRLFAEFYNAEKKKRRECAPRRRLCRRGTQHARPRGRCRTKTSLLRDACRQGRAMDDYRPMVSSKCPRPYMRLMTTCLDKNPDRRPDFLGGEVNIVVELERLIFEEYRAQQQAAQQRPAQGLL